MVVTAGKLEVELTSQRADGVWTWRASGARLPKGTVAGELVPDSAEVGSVLIADTSADIDGLTVIGLSALKKREEPKNRLELIAGSSDFTPSTQLLAFNNNDSRRKRSAKRQSKSGTPGRTRNRYKKHDRSDRKQDRGTKASHRAADDNKSSSTSKHSGKQDSKQGNTPEDNRKTSKKTHRHENKRKPRRADKKYYFEQQFPRLKPKRKHRSAALNTLPKEQHQLAREILQGGVPKLRKTLARLNKKAAANNLPKIKTDALLTLGERLAPELKAAEWRDRVDAALAGIDFLDLRDIRSVVVAADYAARTKEARSLAKQLKSALTSRIESDHNKWLAGLSVAIQEGRTVRALRLSTRPPKAGSLLPHDIHERLAELASKDLSSDTSHQRWDTVLSAVAFSPVRQHVIPVGIPEKSDEKLLNKIRKLAHQVPHIAKMFGIAPTQKTRNRPEHSNTHPRRQDSGTATG
ncbi:MAG: hypothetical protein OXI96_08185 [Acidimicrobiaceae bacterium]|nr:hypothetical protein [Acidimicrobiaceae bacterium]